MTAARKETDAERLAAGRARSSARAAGGVAEFGEIEGDAGAEFPIGGPGFGFGAGEFDGVGVGHGGFVAHVGGPTVSVGEIAPILISVGAELNGFFQRFDGFVVPALEEANGAEVVVNGTGGGNGEGFLKLFGGEIVLAKHVQGGAGLAVQEFAFRGEADGGGSPGGHGV